MVDLNLELWSDPDDDNNQTNQTSSESGDDIDSSEFEESDETDNADDVETSAGPPPPPPIDSSSGANIFKENKKKLQNLNYSTLAKIFSFMTEEKAEFSLTKCFAV